MVILDMILILLFATSYPDMMILLKKKFFKKGKVLFRFVTENKEVMEYMWSAKKIDKEGTGSFKHEGRSYTLSAKRIVMRSGIPELTYRQQHAEPVDYFSNEDKMDAKVLDALLMRIKASALPFADMMKLLKFILVGLGVLGLIMLFLAYMMYENNTAVTEAIELIRQQAQRIAAT